MSIFQQTAKAQLLLSLQTKILAASEMTLGEFLQKGLPDNEKNLLLGFKIGEIFPQPEVEVKEEKKDVKTHIPTEAEGEYKEKVLKFLKDSGLGDSLRGFKTEDIVSACAGDTNVARKVLGELQKDRLVYSTGKTRGLRWVAKEFEKKAEANWLKEQGVSKK